MPGIRKGASWVGDMESCIYEGNVRHRRFDPKAHAFRYRLFMMYLDLEELPHLFDPYWFWSVNRCNLATFQRRRHFGSSDQPLREAISELIVQKGGIRPEGPIRLLTHLTYFGYWFNSVSFYYCFDRSGRDVQTIVAEITNTPWMEQYPYVLHSGMEEENGSGKHYRFQKDFHVSPFMPMNLFYDWRFGVPGEMLTVHMENRKTPAEDKAFFDSTLTLRRRPISSKTLARVLVQYPILSLTAHAAIHVEALRLWLKGVSVFTHPSKHTDGKP